VAAPRVLRALHGRAPQAGGRHVKKAIALLALAAAGVAVAVWLTPASVHIAAWPEGGPLRIAYLAPLLRLGIALARSVLAVGGAVAILGRRGVAADAVARRLAPLSLLLLWLVPYLPWLPDRAPVLLVLAGPLRWAIAAIAAA